MHEPDLSDIPEIDFTKQRTRTLRPNPWRERRDSLLHAAVQSLRRLFSRSQ